MPVVHPGGAGVVGLAGEVQPPPAVRPDRAWPPRPGRPGRPGPGPARRAARRRRRCGAAGPGRARVGRGRLLRLDRQQRLGQAGPVPVHKRQCLLGRQRAGEQAGAEAGHPEPRPLLLGERRDADRPVRGRSPARAAASMASSAETMPSGPSYAPPCGTESKWLPVTTASPAAGSPHQAHRLPLPSGLDGQLAVERLLDEPLPAGQVGLAERVPQVAAGTLVAPDRGQRAPQRGEPLHRHSALPHRDAHAMVRGDLLGQLVAGVDVADDAHAGVVGAAPVRSSARPARCRRRR